jgi:hypothetical protein
LLDGLRHPRRNCRTDQAGYDFWLDVVTNREPGNHRGMVCAFIASVEYQIRFGQQTPLSNGECVPGV